MIEEGAKLSPICLFLSYVTLTDEWMVTMIHAFSGINELIRAVSVTAETFLREQNIM